MSVCSVTDIVDVVPQTADELVDAHVAQISGRKIANSTALTTDMGTEEATFPILDGGTPMLENNSWDFMPDELFPDCNTSSNSKNFTESADMVFCEDGILDNSKAGDGTSLYHSLLDDISPTKGAVNILGNGQENEECSFMSYDGWPDISYIENLDGLFRSSEASCAQETVTNENKMPWLSSSLPTVDESGDALKPTFRTFSLELDASESAIKHPETNACHVPHSTVPNSETSSCSTLYHPSYGGCLDTNAESTLESLIEKQGVNVDDGIEDTMFLVIKTNNGNSEMHDTESRKLIKNRKQAEVKVTYISSEYSHGVPSVDPETPRQFDNPTKRSSDTSPNIIALTSQNTRETHQWKNHVLAMSSNEIQHEGMVNHLPRLHQTQGGVESSQVKELKTEQPDLDTDSSVVLESSGLCSMGFEKIYAEETNFLELQQSMEKLDLTTKLCIRDSLYRLAKSAEQRNNFAQSMNSSRNEIDNHGQGTNDYSGLMDMETDTNPIDRSIAHLLFHKPIEGTSLESHGNVYYSFGHVGPDSTIQ